MIVSYQNFSVSKTRLSNLNFTKGKTRNCNNRSYDEKKSRVDFQAQMDLGLSSDIKNLLLCFGSAFFFVGFVYRPIPSSHMKTGHQEFISSQLSNSCRRVLSFQCFNNNPMIYNENS